VRLLGEGEFNDVGPRIERERQPRLLSEKKRTIRNLSQERNPRMIEGGGEVAAKGVCSLGGIGVPRKHSSTRRPELKKKPRCRGGDARGKATAKRKKPRKKNRPLQGGKRVFSLNSSRKGKKKKKRVQREHPACPARKKREEAGKGDAWRGEKGGGGGKPGNQSSPKKKGGASPRKKGERQESKGTAPFSKKKSRKGGGRLLSQKGGVFPLFPSRPIREGRGGGAGEKETLMGGKCPPIAKDDLILSEGEKKGGKGHLSEKGPALLLT